jgi:serine O-acetyltransferase
MLTVIHDIKAVRRNDPASKSIIEVLLCHTPLHAIIAHRIIHPLYKIHIPILPRFLSQINRFFTGIEIHPGAEIGPGFFIDHGMGVVIGETSKLGKNCILFHNVTLGGTGKHTGKRHPTLGDNVYIGTASILLGPIKVGNNVKIGANTFIIMHDVPDNATVIGCPGRIVKLNGKQVNMELPKTKEPEEEKPKKNKNNTGKNKNNTKNNKNNTSNTNIKIKTIKVKTPKNR